MSRVVLKNIKISPRKLRLVADTVRGERVSKALSFLLASRKKGRKFIFSAIRSCVASIEKSQDERADFDKLRISEISVDEGQKLKRFIPRAMGRSSAIIKRYSRLNLSIEEG